MRKGWPAACFALAVMVVGCGDTPSDAGFHPSFSRNDCGPNAPPLEHGGTRTIAMVDLGHATIHDFYLRPVFGPEGEVEATLDAAAREVTIRSLHRDGPARTDQFQVIVDITFTGTVAGPTSLPMRCDFVVVHTAVDESSAAPSVAAAPSTTAPTTTSRPASTTGATTGIRVTGQPAIYSGPCSQWRVTFVWIIEGTPQPATFQRRTARGNAEYGPEEGPFLMSNSGAMSWDPATGRLTLVGAGDTGASQGFRSQITKVGGKEVTGDATSIAAPGYCS